MVSPWDWSDVILANKESAILAQTVLHDVYIIADVTRTTQVPGNSFSYIQKLTETGASNVRKTILVGTNMFMRTILLTLQKMIPALKGRYDFADNREKAQALLADLGSKQAITKSA